MRLVALALLAFSATPLAAQPALGDPFFADGIGPLPETSRSLEDDSGAFESESYARTQPTQFWDRSFENRATLRMRGTAPDADGPARLTLQRDAEGRIRRASYEAFEPGEYALARAKLDEVSLLFDQAGKVVSALRTLDVETMGDCNFSTYPVSQLLVFSEDGRLLGLDTAVRLTPRECRLSRAVPPAPIPAYESVDVLRAELGLPAADAMVWGVMDAPRRSAPRPPATREAPTGAVPPPPPVMPPPPVTAPGVGPAASAPLTAPLALRDPFFVDGVRDLPVDLVTFGRSQEARAAVSQRRVAASLSYAEVEAFAVVQMDGVRPDADGPSVLTLRRDDQGRVRTVSYDRRGASASRTETDVSTVTYTFDEAGRAAAVSGRVSLSAFPACGESRGEFRQSATLDADGRALDLVTTGPLGDDCDPSALRSALVPAFATTDALRRGFGLASFDALEWGEDQEERDLDLSDVPPPPGRH